MLVSISGTDGSGKTSVAHALVDSLRNDGLSASYSRPRFRTCKQAEHTVGLLLGESTSFNHQPISTIYLHGLLIDWLAHFLEEINRSDSDIIVADRYVYDVVAQAKQIGASLKFIPWFLETMPRADLEVFLDVNSALCRKRVLERPQKTRERFENLNALEVLKTYYYSLYEGYNWQPITFTEQPIEAIVASLKERILRNEKRFGRFVNTERDNIAELCKTCRQRRYP